jgi:hypothetical protein
MWIPCRKLIVLVVLTTFLTCAISKELILTAEWQDIGENETLPAGAHIRIDMTTGQKMAKLLDENDSSQASPKHEKIEKSYTVSSDGNAVQLIASENESMDITDFEDKPKYDYDMMYRALSNLPSEEQERIGLPKVPSVTENLSEEERMAFKEKMRVLWEKRQEEIARIQLELQMDMPEVLKDRISKIKAYLEDPTPQLLDILHKRDEPASEVDGSVISDIISVLVDLEYHLSDLDMTRDFHTLGGWHHLVSLLDPSMHRVNTNETVSDVVARVQMHAAWAIGTAVKNAEEFFSYATETIVVEGKSVTPISLLLDQLVEANERKVRQKYIYALASMLRGNRGAQMNFISIHGPAVLSQILSNVMKVNEDLDCAKRIIALVGDIISDVVLHGNSQRNIINAFAGIEICKATLESLDFEPIRETSIHTIQSIFPFCNWNVDSVTEQLELVSRSWKDMLDIDSQILEERLDLIANTIKAIKEQGS